MGQRSSTTSSQGSSAGSTATLGTASETSPNSSSSSRHHHRSHNANRSSSTLTLSNSATNSNVANMSPRSRFRHEMARRGYTTNSSDIFLRLFQFPSSSSNTNGPNTSSSGNSNNNNNVSSSSSSSNPASGGLSAFRFFNLTDSINSNSNLNNNQINDLDSDLSSDDDEPHWNHNLSSLAQSLPFFFGMRDLKCFVCNKLIPADDVEAHIMMCLTKPRLTYNEDVLTDEKGECVICLEELEKGQTIARLPCLCIYHKHCIDNWLTRSQSCPGHPPD